MFKKIVLFIAIVAALAAPTVAKERRIYSTNQGLDDPVDLTMLYGTWVRADNAKKHKNKFVIITPASPSYLKKAVEFFTEKDNDYRKNNGNNWNPYSSLVSSYKGKLRDVNRQIKLRMKIDAISSIPLEKRDDNRAINGALNHVPKNYDEKLYAGASLAFFKYDLKKDRLFAQVPASAGGSVVIVSDYIAHESLPNRKNHINYKDAIKINKEKYNFDVIKETDVSMLLNNEVNYHFYDIIDENKFIVYRDNGQFLHAYKRATTTYELPFHSQYSPMVEAIDFNKVSR